MTNLDFRSLRTSNASALKQSLKKVLVASACTLAISFSAQAKYTLTDDDVVVTNGEIISCSYGFADKDIVIPATLDGQTVTAIYEAEIYNGGVFRSKGITSVEMPQTLLVIGARAFQGNALTAVTLPANLIKVGDYAFYENSLTTISFPNTVTYIGVYSFKNNNGFGNITLPSPANCQQWLKSDGSKVAVGTSVSMSYYAFTAIAYYTLTDADVTVTNGVLETCSYNFASKFITIPGTLDGQTVVAIKGLADSEGTIQGPFASKGMIEVSLPASVQVIGTNSFYDNNLVSVVFETGSKLVKIEHGAFYRNTSLYLTLPTPSDSGFKTWVKSDGTVLAGGAEVSPSYYGFYAKIPYTLTDADVVVESGVITSCSYDYKSMYITIPDQLDGQTVTGIKALNNNGIFSHKGMMELTLPTTLQSIPFCAFAHNDLSTIDLGRCTTLKSIGNYAFYSNSLTSLVIPSTVESIGYNSFAYNTTLAEVTFAPNSHVNSIYANAFINNASTLTVKLPTPLKSGYTFSKWINDDDETVAAETNIPNYGTAYTAVFKVATAVNTADDLQVSLWPNPVQNKLTVKADNLANVQVCTLTGKTVYSQQASGNQTEIDMANLPNGIYLVSVTGKSGNTSVQKIIKK